MNQIVEPKLAGFPLLTWHGRFNLRRFWEHADCWRKDNFLDCPECAEYERLTEDAQWPQIEAFLVKSDRTKVKP